MAPVREVAFELECFEWADERLEVAGRWKGLGARRLNRPVLTVQTGGGRRKRIVAMPGGHMAAGAETWRASFAWPGDPAEITGAALEVGGSLVVDLPLPDKRRRRRRRPAAEPVDEALRTEVGALRGQVERLRAELAGREREIIALRAQLDEETDEEDLPVAGADERTVEIQRLADERDAARADLSAEVERLAGEREAADAERARFEADLDDLREAFSEAAAEAEAVRDRHREELAALEDQMQAERAQVARVSAELARQIEAERARAAAPPTQPMPPPAADEADDDETGPLPAAPVTPAVDAPGPLRAGARPTKPPFAEGAEIVAAPVTPGPLQALKERMEGLFSTNGHAADEDTREHVEATGAPLPRRSAAAARARAGATVAARRRPAEVWALRILAAVFVAVLLTALLLFVIDVA